MDSLNRLLGIDSESFERAKFEEWKKNGPTWQKEEISQAMILWNRLGDSVGLVRDGNGNSVPPFFSEIRDQVWGHFENLLPEEAVGRERVMDEFEKAISSCKELPEAMKKVYLESLKKPFRSRENIFRRVVGLNPLEGAEDGQ